QEVEKEKILRISSSDIVLLTLDGLSCEAEAFKHTNHSICGIQSGQEWHTVFNGRATDSSTIFVTTARSTNSIDNSLNFSCTNKSRNIVIIIFTEFINHCCI